jgi:hypothetical protein
MKPIAYTMAAPKKLIVVTELSSSVFVQITTPIVILVILMVMHVRLMGMFVHQMQVIVAAEFVVAQLDAVVMEMTEAVAEMMMAMKLIVIKSQKLQPLLVSGLYSLVVTSTTIGVQMVMEQMAALIKKLLAEHNLQVFLKIAEWNKLILIVHRAQATVHDL